MIEENSMNKIYVITGDGIEKARTPGAKDIKPRKRRIDPYLRMKLGLRYEEPREKRYLKDPWIDRARHAYDNYFKKAKKKKLNPEDRLKMAEVNPSGNEN